MKKDPSFYAWELQQLDVQVIYQVSTADSKSENDIELDSNGIKILTDKLSYRYLEGLLIDFKKNGINEGFSFQNPNADATCGCGESFFDRFRKS